MKICACIVEYNPFHNGHLKHLEYVKRELKADKIIAVMSGNFTQRGEPAVLDKFTRAKHAILAGADMVIELPTVFATANAETFAKGAVRIIENLGICDSICFGVESGTHDEYENLAKALNDESKEFKKTLKSHLDEGNSLAKAKFLAVKETSKNEFNESLISSPNNILGLEYVKAILSLNSKLNFYPMIRTGNHNDNTLKKGMTSASSIRLSLENKKSRKLKKCMPKFVYNDLKILTHDYDKIAVAKILTSTPQDMAKILDCSEGLENRIIALAKTNLSLENLIQKVTTKRYTSTRIKRIILANLLGIEKSLVESSLKSIPYAKILAVKNQSKELITLLSNNAKIPVISRKSDREKLKNSQSLCFDKDVLANDIYNLISNKETNENYMLII